MSKATFACGLFGAILVFISVAEIFALLYTIEIIKTYKPYRYYDLHACMSTCDNLWCFNNTNANDYGGYCASINHEYCTSGVMMFSQNCDWSPIWNFITDKCNNMIIPGFVMMAASAILDRLFFCRKKY